MKTLIAYCTTHGCTEKIANELNDFLAGKADLVNLKNNPTPDISEYDRAIIGGSIHAGQIQKRVKHFCSSNLNDLQKKELGLFICCMEKGKKAEIQLMDAYPKVLLQQAKSTACLGGEFNFEKMNFFQKLILKKAAHIDLYSSKIDHEAIQLFSKQMDKVFNPFLFLV